MKRTGRSVGSFVMLLIAALALGLPGAAAAKGQGDLQRYGRDTWRSFAAMASPIGLPADNLCRGDGESWVAARYTSPTNIGAYIWSTLAAEDMRIVTHDEAARRLSRTLATLKKLETAHGFFFNWYDPRTGARLTTWPVDGSAVRPFLSTVDNGWLATALIMLRNARPEFRARADALLAPMHFGFFYDAFNPADPFAHPGQLYGGYWTDTNEYTGFHYGTLNTEPRIASYIGIAMGDIPPQHYYYMYRTLPPEWDWQEQIPAGPTRTYAGVSVVEGHYVYPEGSGTTPKFALVPSWGGSMFEALMVPLFIPEAQWAPMSWGRNHPLYVRAQIDHGLQVARYGYWGFSPSNKPEGGYLAYGVDAIGMEPNGYPSNNDNTLIDRNAAPPAPGSYTNGVVTPHASFLALQFARDAALDNLRKIAKDFDAYGRYGFYDSVNVQTGQVSSCVLALDQGMVMAAIANDLRDGVMQRYFTRGNVEKVIRPLIAPERFSAGRL
jgi:hypothetical protein